MIYILNIIMVAMLFATQGLPAHAQDDVDHKPERSYQGVINHVDPLGYIFVNETKVRLDKEVEIRNHKDKELSVKDLKRGKWVYIVEKDDFRGPTAVKIYVLPKRIKKSEWKKYPFIVKEKED